MLTITRQGKARQRLSLATRRHSKDQALTTVQLLSRIKYTTNDAKISLTERGTPSQESETQTFIDRGINLTLVLKQLEPAILVADLENPLSLPIELFFFNRTMVNLLPI